MSENTNVEGDEGTDESSVINSLRKDLAKAQAEAKSSAEENDTFRTARTQTRTTAVEAAVNGQNYPVVILDALKAQVETASNDEFDKLLQDLGVEGKTTESVDGDTEGGESTDESKTKTTAAELGQQIAAAAAGGSGEVDVIKNLATAETQEDLYAAVAEHGLDKF